MGSSSLEGVRLDRLTCTYALIKSLYDQGEDYLDSFWPFAIKAFPTDTFADLRSIQRSLQNKFGLAIPLHTLTTVLGRARSNGHVELKEQRYRLTQKGLAYLDKFEVDREVERRTNGLVEDMRSFYEKRGIPLSSERVHEVLTSFLQLNLQPLLQFLSPSVSTPAVQGRGVLDELLIEYVKTVEKSSQDQWKTFQDLVLGSIISVVLDSEREEITEITSRSFKHCQVFLDTNFVFSILGLHSPEFNEPAKELFNLLREHAFRPKVFGFTVDEICGVINGYVSQAYRYPTTLAVDSLYSTLKIKGWTKLQARQFIINIESTLKNAGIEIELTKNVNLESYSVPDQDTREVLGNYKPLQDLFHQNHDLAAIDKVKEMRTSPVRKIEDACALFLTSDNRLSAFNFLEMQHKQNGTICEVISDRLLTNLLWLKYPKSRLSLNAIIGVHSRDLFIKRRIWEKFYDVLTELKQKAQVTDQQISTLFYHNYIEDVLKQFDENQVQAVNPAFVLDKIEDAAKLPEKDLERRITEKEHEFLEQLNEERSKSEAEVEAAEKRWLGKLQNVKDKIGDEAENSAKWLSRFCSGVITIVISLVVYAIYLQAGILAFSVFSFLGGTGIIGIWVKLNNIVRIRLSPHIYERRIRVLGLESDA